MKYSFIDETAISSLLPEILGFVELVNVIRVSVEQTRFK
jgi:hypothetical protein